MARIKQTWMSGLLQGVVDGVIAIALWNVLVWLYKQGSSLASRISLTTRRRIVLVAIGSWLGVVILLFGWYLPGIYSDDVALATGSPAPFMVWLFAAFLSLVLSSRVQRLRPWKGGFLVATPLMMLNLFVPSFHSIPFSSASPLVRSWFDVTVGGGAIGEGLFLITFWVIGMKLAKIKLGLNSSTTVSGPPEEIPYNYSTSIFSQLVHVVRGPRRA